MILSSRIANQTGKVVIYGWHKPGGVPMQNVYSGHIWWYVDYSHGIRLINNQVLIDGKPFLLSEVLADPLMFILFSNEPEPMIEPLYFDKLHSDLIFQLVCPDPEGSQLKNQPVPFRD